MTTWGERVPSRGNGKCKGPEAGGRIGTSVAEVSEEK